MKLSPLSLLAALAIVGLIVLAALGAHSDTLAQAVLVRVAAAAGNELPNAYRLASTPGDPPAPAAASSTPYPVSNP